MQKENQLCPLKFLFCNASYFPLGVSILQKTRLWVIIMATSWSPILSFKSIHTSKAVVETKNTGCVPDMYQCSQQVNLHTGNYRWVIAQFI